MSHFMRRTHVIVLLILVLSLVVRAEAQPPEDPQEVLAVQGKSALQLEDFDLAREHFDTGLVEAREQQNRDYLVRFLFYSGLTDQVEGEKQNDDELLRSAEAFYLRVLEFQPDSASTMVNLAQVKNRLGDDAAAEELFDRALSLEPEKAPLYARSYAESLLEAGRGEDASRVLKTVAERDPQNIPAQTALLDVYLGGEDPGEELLDHLWRLVEQGDVLRAQDGALRALENARIASFRKAELLTILVASLSRQFQGPVGFEESGVAQRLPTLDDDPAIDRGIEELLALYRLVGDYSEVTFDWWADAGERRRDPQRGIWPRDAFRGLMRSLGSWYEQRGEGEVAESCYETAATLAPGELDPAAIRDLVDLYARQKNTSKIKELADRYTFELFEGKGAAYRNSQLEKIYEYHRTLGQIYGNLATRDPQLWGDSSTVTSAIFQLEHALRAGESLEQASSRETGQVKTYVDPGLFDLLAQGYEQTNEAARGRELRLEAAERFESIGDTRARDLILEPVSVDELEQGEQQERYQMLIESRKNLTKVERQ